MENKDILDITKTILSIDSPSGYTKNVVDYLMNECISMGYTCEITNKGNLEVTINGENKNALGIFAHVDTLGLMVRSIKPNGNLSFTTIGGPCLGTLDGEYCKIITRDKKVYTGTILSNSPSVHVYPDASTLPRDLNNMEIRIDEEVKNAEDAKKLGIRNGDVVSIDTKTTITNSGFIKSRFLDDKLSVAILLSILKDLKDKKVNRTLKFIFTVFEEVGHGASYISDDITEVLGVDMGCIGLDLACTEYDVSICSKDSSGPYDYEMTSTLISLAEENNLPHAVDIYPMYGSDVSAALRGGNNIKGALIGPGVHASHGMERSHIKGVIATKKLIEAYISKN